MEEQNKNYDKWNDKKKELQKSSLLKTIYFKEGDIWWCSLGLNIGDESFGKGEFFRRPVLVYRKLSNNMCIAIPLTSKEKTGTWFVDITLNSETRCAMLYQIRTLHKKRFQYKIGQLSKADLIKVKEKLEVLLELS